MESNNKSWKNEEEMWSSTPNMIVWFWQVSSDVMMAAVRMVTSYHSPLTADLTLMSNLFIDRFTSFWALFTLLWIFSNKKTWKVFSKSIKQI